MNLDAVSRNPYGDLRRECERILRGAIVKYCNTDAAKSRDALTKFKTILGSNFEERKGSLALMIPSSPNFGDLASSICLEAASQFKTTPTRLAENIISYMDLSQTFLVSSVKAVRGYINFQADNPWLVKRTLESARHLAESYGYVKVDSPQTIIVEHTSVNPVGPVHVGTARNSVLGDSLSRLLKARGHTVSTHFYIDDVGRQIAVLAYGYDLLKRPKPKGKADHWLGLIYAITSCIIEIGRLKRKLMEVDGDAALHNQANETRLALDDWIATAAELQEKDRELFESLIGSIQRQNMDSEEQIARIIQLYERKDPEIQTLIREVVNLCLDGFRETFTNAGIFWDSWDWESDLVWSNAVAKVSNELRKSPYLTTEEGALLFNVNAATEEKQLKNRFGISEEYEIPSLVLSRSDGTTLYSTRDIAYSLWKLQRADKVINVIGIEQSLAQLQIRIALSVLTSPEKADNLIHYAYELVSLPGYKMSKRRGKYVTLDQILDEATKRALDEVETKSPNLPSNLKQKISDAVGIGAVKYALIDVAPSKQVVFTWDKVLNFEMNSAPFIQYAYARASNILEKAEKNRIIPDYALLKEPTELEIVRKIALFPETFIVAADSLTPSLLTEFAHDLAAKFNSFYASFHVLKANPQELRDARLALVDSVKITLKNVLSLLGIETLERM